MITTTLSQQILQHPIRTLLAVTLIIPLTYILTNEYIRRTRRIPGFSGPTNWPLVGNIPDIKYNAAEKYREWSKIHGAVYQIQLGNEPVLVVNSADTARRLFGGNGSSLSSRPVFWTFHKVLCISVLRVLNEDWEMELGLIEDQ